MSSLSEWHRTEIEHSPHEGNSPSCYGEDTPLGRRVSRPGLLTLGSSGFRVLRFHPFVLVLVLVIVIVIQ